MNRQGEQNFKRYLTEQIDYMQEKKKEMDVNLQYHLYTEIEVKQQTLKRVLSIFESVQEFK